MLFILYGEDTYRSRRRLHELIDTYQAQENGEVLRFDLEENDWVRPVEALMTPLLFAQKRIVICERVFSSEYAFKQLESALMQQLRSVDTLVVLWEAELKEKYKQQLQSLIGAGAKAEAFAFLKSNHLASWIEKEAYLRGVVLDVAHRVILQHAGSDLWRVTNTLEKMALSAGSSMNQLEQYKAHEVRIFDLGDAMWDEAQAIRLFLRLMQQGDDVVKLYGYLGTHVRSLLMVHTMRVAKTDSPHVPGLHPFVIKKALALLARLNPQRIWSSYAQLFRADIQLKTGILSPENSLLLFLLGIGIKKRAPRVVSQNEI